MRAWTSARRPSATSSPTSRKSACWPSPHTSAGRIPTAQGYRVFVDSLLQMQPLGEGEVARLRAELPAGVGHPGAAGQRLGTAVGDDPFRRRGQRAAARAVRLPPHRFRAAGRPPGAGDPGVRRQRGAEPGHRTAPRLRPRPSWSGSPTTSTPTSPAGRWPRSAPRCCATCATPQPRWRGCWPHTVELAEQALRRRPTTTWCWPGRPG